MLASVWAVVAGFLVMAVLVMAGSMILMRIYAPGAMEAMRSGQMTLPPPTAGYIVRNIILSLGAAVAGGMVTLRLAPSAPTGHLAALGLVVLAMGLVSAKSPGSAHQPAWYRVAIPFVGLGGVLLAGVLG
ncbi:MAG TPA: hypothetical protein VG692_07640 [Gemmatimonadales bacterium]|nr:hypothetical protein [Gemmatimonadales bacterium]